MLSADKELHVMKHKARECVWAPGMQDTDITYAGEHTWAEINRLRKQADSRGGPGAPTGLFLVLGAGAMALFLGGWLIY